MTTYTVANQSQLNDAILELKGGDKIVVAAGSYDVLNLNATYRNMSHVKFETPVSIVAEDENDPPVFDELDVLGAANVIIEGMKFDHSGSRPDTFRVESSTKVTIRDSTFDGHKDGDGYGTGNALVVSNSENIVVEGNDIYNFNGGLHFWDVENLLVKDNDISGIKNDASTFSEIIGGRIEGNVYHDAHSPDNLTHKDAIQFWANGDQIASEDIIIRGNTFSNNEAAHSIYMGNDAARSDASKAFVNILIEDNAFKAGHIHGVVIEHVNGVVIRNNLLERFPGLDDRQITTPVITVGVKSQHVSITGNTVASLQEEANGTWDISDNTITGGSRFVHWEGAIQGNFWASATDMFNAWLDRGRPDPDVLDLGELLTSFGNRQRITFYGDEVDAGGRQTELDVDFAGGDVLVLRAFEEDTFASSWGGNYLEKGILGRYARIDSVADLAELAEMSQDVDAWVNGQGALVVQIEQEDRGTDTFTFSGLGAAFYAANDLNLF